MSTTELLSTTVSAVAPATTPRCSTCEMPLSDDEHVEDRDICDACMYDGDVVYLSMLHVSDQYARARRKLDEVRFGRRDCPAMSAWEQRLRFKAIALCRSSIAQLRQLARDARRRIDDRRAAAEKLA